MIQMKFALVLLLWPVAASAALTPAALNSAGISLPADAQLALTWTAPDMSGTPRSLGELLEGKPGFVLFADYTCKTLCGPALVLLGAALTDSRLPPDSWHLIVIGLDPKDSATDARKMMQAQVPKKLWAQTAFLLPGKTALASAVQALGFHYVYDRPVDQFAHPEVVYALSAEGRVLRVLSPLTLGPMDVTTALSGTPDPPQTLYGRFRVLCYRFGVLSGIYDKPVELGLKAGAVLTLAAMVLGFLILLRRKPSRWT